MSADRAAPPAVPGTGWALDALLDDPGTTTLVCAGSGGVGKTTTAAAIAVRAAERGRGVVVLTVDPSQRLAQALGVAAGQAQPQPVPGVDTSRGGSLHAAVLDARAVLDGLVDDSLPPERAATLRENAVYASVASSFSGTQEYMAMERVGQLRSQARSGRAPWDLVVVDTPPSRSALDFIDAPARLGRFLDGRFVALLRRGTSRGLAGAVSSRVRGSVIAAMDRVLGAHLLADVQELVAGLDVVFGSFQERAKATSAALAARGSAFVVVTAAEDDALAESAFLLERLASSDLPTAALVVNRAAGVVPSLRGLSADAARDAARRLRQQRGAPDGGARGDGGAGGDGAGAEGAGAGAEGAGTLGDGAPGEGGVADGGLADAAGAAAEDAAALLGVHADLAQTAGAERARVEALLAGHDGVAVAMVPVRSGDVHDLATLREVGEDLARTS